MENMFLPFSLLPVCVVAADGFQADSSPHRPHYIITKASLSLSITVA